MALINTTDSIPTVGANRWAFVRPLRKFRHNLTITAAPVVIALLIAGIEALGLLASQFGLEGGVWSVISGLNDDLTNLGVAVIGIFLAAWAVSTLIYRWKGNDRLIQATATD
jgi:high-affinity nickel-transport protein